jgi:hypothetical protein
MGFSGLSQAAQPRAPERFQKRTQLLKTLWPHRVEPLGALPALRHKAGLLQHAQVLRNGWARHREMRRYLASRKLGACDQAKDFPAACLRDGPNGCIHGATLAYAYVSVN